MSDLQRGEQPSGISGTFLSSPDGSGQYKCQSFFWAIQRYADMVERYGQVVNGDAAHDFRQSNRSGKGKALVTITTEAPPEPAEWNGATLSFVCQIGIDEDDVAITKTYSIVVESFDDRSDLKASYNDTSAELWYADIGFRTIGDPTYSANWGDQEEEPEVDLAKVRQYRGTSFTWDADDLGTAAIFNIDWYASNPRTDADLRTLIEGEVGEFVATDFDPGLKANPSTIRRDSPTGGTISIPFQRTTPAERIIDEATGRTVDPSALDSHETTAAFNTTPGSGSISGLVSRGISFKEYNDANTLQVKNWGPTTTQEDWEFPRTTTEEDLSTIPLSKETSEGHVTSSATPSNPTPSGAYKLRRRDHVQLTDAGKYGHHYVMGLTTPQEDEENQSSVIYADASGIGSYEVHGRVVATVSTSDPSGAPSGMSLVSTSSKEIHDNAFHRVFKYGLLTTKESIEHGGTSSQGTPTGDMPPSGAPSISTAISTVASTDTTHALEWTAYIAAQADTAKPFSRISVRKRNKLTAETRTFRPGDDFSWHKGQGSMSYIQSALDASGAYVTIKRAIAIVASTSCRLYISHWDLKVNHVPIVLRRWRRAAKFSDISYVTLEGTKGADVGSGAIAGAVTITTGAVSAIAISAAGSGYSSTPPKVIIRGDGSGALATAVLTTGAVTSVTIGAGGSGYTQAQAVFVGGNTVFGYPVATLVYHGAINRGNLIDDAGSHWILVDYIFQANYVNTGGILTDANFSDGGCPRDQWVDLAISNPGVGTGTAASTLDASYVRDTLLTSNNWATAFFATP